MIYFLSDAHLGSRAIADGQAHQQRFVSLLRKMGEDATAIWLLGDIFDFWYEYFFESQERKEKAFGPVLDCLRELTDRGIEVHYFIGNHDIWTFGWLERRTGVILHRTPLETVLAGHRVMLAHGDGIVPSCLHIPDEYRRKVRTFMRLRAFFHHPVPQFLFRCLVPAWGDELGYEWARRSREKELKNPLLYKGENEEELVLYAKEQEALGHHHDLYIFGHRHIELDLLITRDSRVIILGDCFRQWTYTEMTEEGVITQQLYETE